MTRSLPQIDKDIDANERAAVAMWLATGNPKPKSASQWQALRDSSPAFDRRDHELYRERGLAQLERDQREHDRAMASARSVRTPRAKKCPTCGHHTLRAA